MSAVPAKSARRSGTLRGDADRAGVGVALPRHHAAQRHQRRGAESVFVRAERRRDRDVAAGLEAAVGLQHDASAQSGARQRVVRLRQADLPRHPGVLDRARGDAPVPPSCPLI